MEKQLVSFGNYLLKKCNVKGYSLDGESIIERMVTDSDICNWKDSSNYNYLDNLPSQHKPGDKVCLNFYSCGFITNCKVIKIHFTESKVLYDVELEMLIPTLEKQVEYSTRLYNIDSSFVVIIE